jgi:hypothetical protein
LLTPLFPVIGFTHLLLRHFPAPARLAVTGGTSVLYFSLMTLAPNAFFYAPILLPFAVGNGLTSALVYAAVEKVSGGPSTLARRTLGGVPLAGPVIGVATAIAAPFTYPAAWLLVWPDSALFESASVLNLEVYSIIKDLTFNSVMLPCLAVTGGAAGALLHGGLKPLILGVEGHPWGNLAGAVLLATTAGLGALYSTSVRTEIEVRGERRRVYCVRAGAVVSLLLLLPKLTPNIPPPPPNTTHAAPP